MKIDVPHSDRSIICWIISLRNKSTFSFTNGTHRPKVKMFSLYSLTGKGNSIIKLKHDQLHALVNRTNRASSVCTAAVIG